jgi:hypothetical protein
MPSTDGIRSIVEKIVDPNRKRLGKRSNGFHGGIRLPYLHSADPSLGEPRPFRQISLRQTGGNAPMT